MKFSQMPTSELEELLEVDGLLPAIKKSVNKELNLRKSDTKIVPKVHKFEQDQNPTVAFPSSCELLSLAQQNRAIQNMFYRQFPTPLVELAQKLVALQNELLEATHDYDHLYLNEKAKVVELSKEEELQRKRLERDSKRAKERKKYLASFRGLDKKIIQRYGKTMDELQAELIEAFKKFSELQAQVNTMKGGS